MFCVKNLYLPFYCSLLLTSQLIFRANAAEATNAKQLQQELAEQAIRVGYRNDHCEGKGPVVTLYQGEAIPPTHPLANFHLAYNPQTDMIYLNTQKIDISLGGDIIRGLYVALARRDYIRDNGTYFDEEGGTAIAYFRGRQARKTHNTLNQLKAKQPNLSAMRLWNERNKEALAANNKQVSAYKIATVVPFQESLPIDWRSYLLRYEASKASVHTLPE